MEPEVRAILRKQVHIDYGEIYVLSISGLDKYYTRAEKVNNFFVLFYGPSLVPEYERWKVFNVVVNKEEINPLLHGKLVEIVNDKRRGILEKPVDITLEDRTEFAENKEPAKEKQAPKPSP